MSHCVSAGTGFGEDQSVPNLEVVHVAVLVPALSEEALGLATCHKKITLHNALLHQACEAEEVAVKFILAHSSPMCRGDILWVKLHDQREGRGDWI